MKKFTDEQADEMFYRLQLGTTLVPAEKRRALPSKMREVVTKLSEHQILDSEKFPKFIRFSKKRLGAEDAIAKVLHQFIAKEIIGISAASIENTYLENDDITMDHPAVKRVKRSMNFMKKAFGPMRPPGLRKGVFISILFVVDNLIKEYNITSKTEFGEEFASTFIKFIEEEMADREKREEYQDVRFAKWRDAIRADDPQKMKLRVDFLTERFLNNLKNLERKGTKRDFTDEQRTIIYARDEGICQICGDKTDPIGGDPDSPTAFHADHIVPHTAGGPTSIENGQTTHLLCNEEKGSKQ